MSLITVSRGSYSKGKEIAEKVAQKLNYDCISRDVLFTASKNFNIDELRLIRAIHDAPSFFDKLSIKKEQYISYIQTTLLENFQRDNIVYHGLAGHFFVTGVSHALKVRIIADLNERAKLEAQREGISIERALVMLKKDDEERRKWSQYLYGIDTHDPSLYDLVIHIHRITVDMAVDIICDTVQSERFQTTKESQRFLDELVSLNKIVPLKNFYQSLKEK
jgi:cytidylate kinase